MLAFGRTYGKVVIIDHTWRPQWGDHPGDLDKPGRVCVGPGIMLAHRNTGGGGVFSSLLRDLLWILALACSAATPGQGPTT